MILQAIGIINPPPQVIVIGNIVADFIATQVAKLPAWGQLIEIQMPINMHIGGNAAIFAVCSTKLGMRTGLIGKFSNNMLGKLLKTDIAGYGVDVSHTKFTDTPQSITLVVANPEGERCFFHHIGSNATLCPADVDFDYIATCKWLLLCSYFIVPGLAIKDVEKILAHAKSKGINTAVDVAWDPKDEWNLDGILQYTDLILPNIDEAQKLTGEATVEAAASALIDAGVNTVAIKLGPAGSYVCNNRGDKYHVASYKVNAIDTTGAGDAFNAGFIYGMIQNWALERTAKFANAVGALTTTKIGGTMGAPTIDDVNKFIENYRD
jgi:sugar/nucleoside kinase (ribokinase family)